MADSAPFPAIRPLTPLRTPDSLARRQYPVMPPGRCWLASLRLRTGAASGHDDLYPASPAPSDPPESFTNQLRLAAAAYLARFKGSSREHTESDLRCYLSWCAERGLDPLAARRPHLELYIRFRAWAVPVAASA